MDRIDLVRVQVRSIVLRVVLLLVVVVRGSRIIIVVLHGGELMAESANSGGDVCVQW